MKANAVKIYEHIDLLNKINILHIKSVEQDKNFPS